jgi:hypothetical protein
MRGRCVCCLDPISAGDDLETIILNRSYIHVHISYIHTYTHTHTRLMLDTNLNFRSQMTTAYCIQCVWHITDSQKDDTRFDRLAGITNCCHLRVSIAGLRPFKAERLSQRSRTANQK